ncbi:hypothetical protein ACFYU9_00560 [Streptomyces sp. NPDC004327]|uniref:hypothetical protein n=1 Tax=unclassified Streptomyces TaxID=2593676 RepID=UPI0036CD26B6
MPGNLFIPIDYSLNGPGSDDGTQRPWNGSPVWYANNSIWVDPGVDKAQIDQETHVKVRVSNKGDTLMKAVTVDAWFFVPGIGDMSPSSALKRFSSGQLDIKAGESVVFTADASPVWKPSDPELAKTQGGHGCIIANCYQSDEVVANPEGAPVGETTPVDPTVDQHLGQRNITLVKVSQDDAPAPQKVPYTTFPPRGGNPEVMVNASPANPRIDRIDPTSEFVLASQEGIEAFEAGMDGGSGLNLITSGGPVEIRPSTDPPSFELSAEGMPRELGTRFRFDEGRPDQIDSEIMVRLPANAEIGSLHTFDLGMYDADDVLIGSGLRVLVLVTE